MTIIIFLLVAIVSAIVLQHIFLSNTLKNVTYRSRPSKDVVEPNEQFTIISELHNNKRLPEFYIHVSEKFPSEAILREEAEKWIHRTFYIRSYQRITSYRTIALPKRGRYLLQGATLTGGDFLGMKTKIETRYQSREIIVSPERADSPVINKLLGGFLGDISVRRFIMPDPVLAVGVREYSGQEPQKDISWVHSARAGQLQVKLYDYTLELAAAVMLNIQTDVCEDLLEQCLCLCRTVCEYLEKKSIKYSFATNAIAVGSVKFKESITDGLGKGHLLSVLEWLGRSSVYARSQSFESLLNKALRKAEQSRFHIIVTPVAPSQNLQLLINRLRVTTGVEVLVITPDKISDSRIGD